MNSTIYDFIGIGIGPFNLGLAALTEPLDDLHGLFLDQREGFDWHPGLMLSDAHLQTPFMSDLVTLADPTHPLSFLNYIKQQGRIYSFYIRENFFLLRKEYNQYCQWAVQQLPNLLWNTRVHDVTWDAAREHYRVEALCTRTGKARTFFGKRLVLGTGPSPYFPASVTPVRSQAVHSGQYLFTKERLQKQKAITLIGSGQSAAEIFHDLLADIDQHGYQLNWITRSPRFFPLEYSKLTLEMTSPEYVDYFYQLPEGKREELNQKQKSLYKGINLDLINAIHELLYQKRLNGPLNVRLMTNTDLRACRPTERGMELNLQQQEQNVNFNVLTEGLVLATGYSYEPPAFLAKIRDRIRWDGKGRYEVQRNYAIDVTGSGIFVQNAEMHTHGFVTPDLGMACYRNSYLIREMTGVEHYPIETQIAFQQFAAPRPARRVVNESIEHSLM